MKIWVSIGERSPDSAKFDLFSCNISAGGDVLAGLGLDTVAAAAQSKVLATLPPELRARAGRVRERFHLDAPGWFAGTEPVPCLGTVAGAVWSGQRLDVRYGRPGRMSRRRVDPLGLVLKAGVWYLVARHERDIRSYRVARIAEAIPCPGPAGRFPRPADFTLAGWWARPERLRLDRPAPADGRRRPDHAGRTNAELPPRMVKTP